MSADYILLEYLGNDRLYLPVDRINLINKYEGSEDTAPQLDKLGRRLRGNGQRRE